MRILHSKKLVFVSKPRCGSTSVRGLLTQNMEPGDVKIDVPDHDLGLHPHMSATSIKEHLRKTDKNPSDYFFFTVTRDPLDMLWSYYKYFKPDYSSRFNYDPKHNAEQSMPFQDWLVDGKVGIGRYWKRHVPDFVTEENLSPLSLEAHICNKQSKIDVDAWYKIEDIKECADMLSDKLRVNAIIPTLNRSHDENRPTINESTIEKIAPQFPIEMMVYY